MTQGGIEQGSSEHLVPALRSALGRENVPGWIVRGTCQVNDNKRASDLRTTGFPMISSHRDDDGQDEEGQLERSVRTNRGGYL
jgi:hypothetical protein